MVTQKRADDNMAFRNVFSIDDGDDEEDKQRRATMNDDEQRGAMMNDDEQRGAMMNDDEQRRAMMNEDERQATTTIKVSVTTT